jgi:hypothetical protein
MKMFINVRGCKQAPYPSLLGWFFDRSVHGCMPSLSWCERVCFLFVFVYVCIYVCMARATKLVESVPIVSMIVREYMHVFIHVCECVCHVRILLNARNLNAYICMDAHVKLSIGNLKAS